MNFLLAFFILICFLPAISEMLLLSSMLFSSVINFNYPQSQSFMLIFFISWIGVSVLLYFLVAYHHVITLLKIKNKKLRHPDTLYIKCRIPILLSVTLSLSTFFTIFLGTFLYQFGAPFDSPIFSKVTAIVLMYLVIKLVPITKIVRLVAIIFFLLVIGATAYFFIGMIDEFRPHVFFDFPLNDPMGKYILNYDGDYWLTYYEIKKECPSDSKQNCYDLMEKKGNTSIMESPVNLEPLLDKAVRVEGTFTATNSYTEGEGKEFCLNTNGEKTCQKSKGPGIWYASPLKITSITLE